MSDTPGTNLVVLVPRPKPLERRGGHRPGAGRKKGSHNRRTEEAMAMAREAGCDPVKFLIEAMQDETLPIKDRIECAKAVAPYVAPRLASMEARVTTGRTHEECLEDLDDEDD
jgi:hypothetical protein